MVTYARGDSPFGVFEAYSHNPVLTNRNLGGYEVQGVGHGDLIQDNNGNWWMLHLGFRQIGRWATYHHLGREVFLTPVTFEENGWFTAGYNGTTTMSFDTDRIDNSVVQKEKKCYTFENTEWEKDWCFLRIPAIDNYQFEDNRVNLKGTNITLDKADSPTFIGIRQKDFNAVITCDICISDGEAGVTIYMDENHHYDLAIRQCESGFEAIERLNVGDIKSVEKVVPLKVINNASLVIHATNDYYSFSIKTEEKEISLGKAQTRYLSSEVAGGFTGVLIGLYAYSSCRGNYAEFTNFSCEYI
jgi:alpha-N-arabinofuranosidase